MLDAVKIPPQELAAGLVAVSFAAGLNVYATVATLGLLAHAGVLPLPSGLDILSSWLGNRGERGAVPGGVFRG